MNLIYAAAAFLLALVLTLVGVTRVGSWLIERRNPPVGSFFTVNGLRIHAVHVPAPPSADLPPVVVVHGASANLKDQMVPLRPLLEGRAEMLFFDRPGYGWSERGSAESTPEAQAELLAKLMDQAGIQRAVLVGHSFGGSVVIAFALAHPERVAGLVFASAATHPWASGKTSWYYTLTAVPVIGRLFAETLAYPAGILRMADATTCVFAPNPVPDHYLDRTSIEMVLRPGAFRANAIDVESLHPYATQNQRRYRSIAAPTVVISGDADTVVYEEIHSAGLIRDIPGAIGVWVHNLGHKPDWVAPDLIVAAIEKVAGRPVDLQAAARSVESRIAADRSGAGVCADDKPAPGELAPI